MGSDVMCVTCARNGRCHTCERCHMVGGWDADHTMGHREMSQTHNEVSIRELWYMQWCADKGERMTTHAGELEGFEKWRNDEKAIASTIMTHPARNTIKKTKQENTNNTNNQESTQKNKS